MKNIRWLFLKKSTFKTIICILARWRLSKANTEIWVRGIVWLWSFLPFSFENREEDFKSLNQGQHSDYKIEFSCSKSDCNKVRMAQQKSLKVVETIELVQNRHWIAIAIALVQSKKERPHTNHAKSLLTTEIPCRKFYLLHASSW